MYNGGDMKTKVITKLVGTGTSKVPVQDMYGEEIKIHIKNTGTYSYL
jgi:hypothetical protein